MRCYFFVTDAITRRTRLLASSLLNSVMTNKRNWNFENMNVSGHWIKILNALTKDGA